MASNMLPTSYQEFIHKSRYARWMDDEGRRENWLETVSRYVNFMLQQFTLFSQMEHFNHELSFDSYTDAQRPISV